MLSGIGLESSHSLGRDAKVPLGNHVFFRQAVTDDSGDSPVKEIEDAVIDTTDLDPKFP